MTALHIPGNTYKKRKSWTIIGLFLWNFNRIFRHPPVYQNYTYVLTNSSIARSAKCSKKHLFKLLTYLLSVVKTWPQSYCDTRCGVIQMWILINSKDIFCMCFILFMISIIVNIEYMCICCMTLVNKELNWIELSTYNQGSSPHAIALKHLTSSSFS